MSKHVLCLIGEGVILALLFILLVYVVVQVVTVFCIAYPLVELGYYLEVEDL